MLKKWLLTVFLFSVIFALTACVVGKTAPTDGTDFQTASPTEASPAEQTTEATTQPSTVETEEPTTEATTEPTTVPTEEPETEATTAPQGRTYILNTNSKKFHYTTCSSVDDMNEANKKSFTGARSELIAMGYEPCGRCKP